jgi:hypothetical protein
MAEAAQALHKSRRWLQDWLSKNPVDQYGTPFYSPMGRTKLFDENDLARIRAATREIERCRLSSSRRARAKRRITPSAEHTSESTLNELRALLKSAPRKKSSMASSEQSNLASMPQSQNPQ